MSKPPHRDPRRAGGNIAGPDGPHDRHAVIVDTTDAVLLDDTEVVLVEPHRDGVPGPPILGMLLAGRINKTTDRTRILYLLNEDGAAAIISELVGLAGRAGPEFAAHFQQILDKRLRALPPKDTT